MGATKGDDRPRVLVVDDDAFVLRVLDDTLADDFSVTTASSGDEALNALAEHVYAVLLADQRMPGMTGVQLAARARELQPDLVAVMLSAYTDPTDMIAAINEGQVFRFLRKPWDVTDLLHTIGQAAERHRLRRDNARLVEELERRLKGLAVLQDVFAASADAETQHTAETLLERLPDVLPYDLAGLLFAGDAEEGATLRLSSTCPVPAPNLLSLRDQMVALFALAAGSPVAEERLHVSTAAAVADTDAERVVRSQVHVPVRLEGRVIGVLAVQAFAADAYPADATRLLDLLANGAAEAVVRLRQAAGRQRRRLEETLEALPDAVVLTDGGGRVLTRNASARRLLGRLESAGDALWGALGIEPESVPFGSNASVERAVEIDGLRLLARVTRSRTVPGAEAGILITLRDVTALEAEDLRRRDYVSTLSHEIRTPLTSIIATLDLLLSGVPGELTAKQAEYLQIADDASESLKRLIDGLLDLEKFERGARDLRRGTTRLETLANNLIARYQAAASERGLRLVVEADDDLPTLSADAARLEQVVGNLLLNAIKFAAADSTVRISVSASKTRAGWVVLGVHNGGEPIPAADLAIIFDRFRQGRRSSKERSSHGTGLGLAICRAITEAHGGCVLAESSDMASRFWVALPLDENPPLPTGACAAPIWIASSEPDAERIAAAAVVARYGLGVYLLPASGSDAEAARAAVGQGLVLAIGDSKAAALPGAVVTGGADGPTLEAVAAALETLVALPEQAVTLAGAAHLTLELALRGLGIEVVRADEGATPAGAEVSGSAAECLVSLARQMGAAERRGASIRRLMRAARRSGADRAGALCLRHLVALRATHGSSSEAALVKELHAAVRRVVEAGNGLQGDCFAATAVVTGERAAVDAALLAIARQVDEVAPLYYRKKEREAGRVRIGEDAVPLATVSARSFAIDGDEAAVVAFFDSETA